MNNHPKFRICILNWNGGSHLSECINSIKNNTYSNLSITVIDNGSTDRSVDTLDSEVQLVKLDSNYGFAAGYNYGLNKIISEKDEFLILLNFDTIVKNDFITCLAESINKYSSKNIFGVKILYADNRDLVWYAGGKINLKKGIIRHLGIRKKLNYISNDFETDYVTGCCMVIHKDIFKALNGFDDVFFMYNEDVDLCLRARDKGLRCIFLNNPQIFHKVSLSVGGKYAMKKIIMKIKSTYILYRKSFNIFSSLFYFLLYLFRSGLRFVFRY